MTEDIRKKIESRDYLKDVRAKLYMPPEPSDPLLPVGEWLDSQEARDYTRLHMYHMLVAQNIIAAITTQKMTEEDYQRALKKGSTRAGLEQMAAVLFFRSVVTYDEFERVNMVTAQPYTQGDQGPPFKYSS